jgi:AAA+ ATPase superfamily predicted ATPase
MSNNNSRNAFEAMCELAQEGWCWRLPCTTCGNHSFRSGFLALSRGGHPDTEDWLPKLAKQYTNWGWWGYSESEIEFLIDVLSDASIRNIANRYDQIVANDPYKNYYFRKTAFPDWLGYMGQALHEIECSEHWKKCRRLTMSWIPQLIEILPSGTAPINGLEEILSNPNGRLQLPILEEIETALIGYPREWRKRQKFFEKRAA